MSPFSSGSVLNPPGTSTGRAVEHGPRLPVLELEPEERLLATQRDGVHAKCVEQIGTDFAEHLIDLGHFDRRARRIEFQSLPQPVDAAGVHARGRCGPEVQRDSVRLFVS